MEVSMSFIRFQIDIAVKQPIPDELKERLPAIRREIRRLKAYASKIKEGSGNEETTVKASYHICHHDEGLPCEPEQDI